ncbi:telomere-binding protein 1-like [Miscanthus floridulus]|uniref:telomere-binding protein 1-like n=1 Tax=Miscanthus floridulus TaxID=154761 RepID=UPI00345A3300
MMVRKRLVYRSRGRRIPTMPRVPNSARGKRSTRRKKDENDLCAFDLLATVAGNLLADQDNSSNVPNTNAAKAKKRKSVKEEHSDEILPLKDVAMEKDVGSGSVSAFPRQANNCLAENSSTRNEAESILESLTMKSNMLAKIPECGSHGIHHPGPSSSVEPEQVQQAEPKVIRRQADGHAVAYGIFDSMDVDGKPPALVSSDSSSCVPLSSHDKEHQTSSLYRGEVRYTADRDDDENSSGCPHPSTIENKGCKPQYLGNHRIRKLLASKVRKAARNKICGGIPSKKICGGLSNKGSKLNLCGKKISTTRQKVQRTIFKKKKLAHHTTSFAKEMLTEASRTSFATGGQNKSCESENYHVKLRIKSFNIPELFIKVPENATIGSLKRTVMDVVNSIMEGGLRVGVLLQGKDIQDDNKTLRQAGICHDKKLNNIDFTLQCERERESPSGVIIPEQMDFLTADMVEPLARMKCEEPFPEADVGDDNQQSKAPYRSRSLSDLYSVHGPVEMASQDTSASSQAIIPVSPAPSDIGALAIVPLCKSKQSEIGQRRIRRPFTVGEVEALVGAVEQLGTGRWRAVKTLAFDNIEHRTYVDLKDKWKTLVHTASISPQQRRGQPVPQELLDRVLAAQAYWSQHLQDKPRGKARLLPEICFP